MTRTPLQLDARIVELRLAERFTIATHSWDAATSVFVSVRWRDHVGVGEAQPDERSGESGDSVLSQLQNLDLSQLSGPFDLEGVGELLPAGTARCALDIALHDLAAQIAGIPLAAWLGVAGRAVPSTSVTLPIQSVDEMVERAQKLPDYPILKMKLGFDGDIDAVRAVRDVFGATLRVDANEGWSVAEARARLKQLERFDIELCEQPIPAGDRAGLAELRAATSIAVFADEDVCTAQDVAQLADAVDGINIKLRKAGGIREAMRAVAVARAHRMGVMVGCNLESGVATTAAACVATLVDHVDLDGPLLLAEDPFPGVRYSGADVELPPGPGLGLSKRPE